MGRKGGGRASPLGPLPDERGGVFEGSMPLECALHRRYLAMQWPEKEPSTLANCRAKALVKQALAHPQAQQLVR